MRVTDSDAEVTKQLRSSAGWGMAIGVVLILLGIVAIARPFYATIASTLVFGWLFVIAGVVQSLYAIQGHHRHRVWNLILGILSIIAGIVLLASPIAGALALTLILGITIFAQGVMRVIVALQMKPDRQWGWVLTNGILSIILGIFIWSRWPLDADWILGLWVGITLLAEGIAILILALAARSASRSN